MTAHASLSSDLEHFVNVSRQLGQNTAYVQGGGGNTSFKVDGTCMWVKASGMKLAEVGADNGFIAVNYLRIRQELGACKTETDYTEVVRASVMDAGSSLSGRRPSIEAGFHAMLSPAVVLHSHSVLANLLACTEEGEELCRTLLPEAIWIPYASPGLPVTSLIGSHLSELDPDQPRIILMLQNHGLVVAAATPDAAWQLHSSVNAVIQSHFKLADPVLKNAPCFVADAAQLLFPDQAVYLGHEGLRQSEAGEETQQVYNFLRATMDDSRLTPSFLPSGEADFLLSMEAEKYRQKVSAS